ncbi:hypothetical protein ASL14_24120 [Paenibacillus sp. IHB B 3084]|uniref:hypothetical protein n=1 Tax=Paenibacillus sp. IHB B 3084 TaxID=867076 RepID=UPI0007204FD8|nr:hypothetical protein [Paenibacillus sp. IHB B 3084]ALP38787.1 hypothetical protein ASL14_24120 [Paenibacillus sp. IHB B 3084]
MYVQAKLNSRALLDQVFPAFEKVFSNLFSATALRVLQSCLNDEFEKVESIIQEQTGKSHSKDGVGEKANQLRQALLEWANNKRSITQSMALVGMVSLLLEFQKQLSRLEETMEEISATLPEVDYDMKRKEGKPTRWL